MLRLPASCLVVLAGPVTSGKSTWAAAHVAADRVVSSDRPRAVVGTGEDDIAASADAFALLEEIVARHVGRGPTTVVDTTGLAAEYRARPHRVPAAALTAQMKAWPGVRDVLPGEGFDAVLVPDPVRVARYAASVHAGTVEDHVGRFRELAEAGVAEVVVRLPGLVDAEPLARMVEVIRASR